MQTAGDLVGGVIELPAGMQHGQNHLGSRTAFLRVDIHRNSTAVVRHRDGLIGMDGDRDVGAKAGQRFVDGVVDDLKNHVVETGAVIGVADVHSRAFSDGVKAF